MFLSYHFFYYFCNQIKSMTIKMKKNLKEIYVVCSWWLGTQEW